MLTRKIKQTNLAKVEHCSSIVFIRYLQQKCYNQYGYQEAGGFKQMEIQVHWLAHHPSCHYTKWYLKNQDD